MAYVRTFARHFQGFIRNSNINSSYNSHGNINTDILIHVHRRYIIIIEVQLQIF